MMSHLTIDSIHFQPSNKKTSSRSPGVLTDSFPEKAMREPPSDSHKSCARLEEVEPKSCCWIPVIFPDDQTWSRKNPQFYRIQKGRLKYIYIYLPYTSRWLMFFVCRQISRKILHCSIDLSFCWPVLVVSFHGICEGQKLFFLIMGI